MRLERLVGRRQRRQPAARGRARRPVLERLEGRTVPASYTAASVTDLVVAISAANQTREADTITLAAGKTFTLTAADNTADGPTGLPVIGAGEDLTIVGNGDVIERSTAAGTPAFRIFDVAGGGSLKLQNLTLQGGLALGTYTSGGVPQWSAQGGAVCSRGALILSGVTVQNCTAQGADVFVLWGGAPLTPPGPGTGGGVYSEGTLTLEGSTIRGNSAIGGKGIAASASFAQIPGGSGLGGGLYVAGGTASIGGSTVSANTARGGAGGAGGNPGSDNGGIDGGPSPASPGGDGGNGYGGGIYAAAGSVTVHTTSVSDNLAAGGAGGAGGKRQPDGQAGQGICGGLYIDAATVHLDTYTVDHLKRNKASTNTKDQNIHGSYSLDP